MRQRLARAIGSLARDEFTRPWPLIRQRASVLRPAVPDRLRRPSRETGARALPSRHADWQDGRECSNTLIVIELHYWLSMPFPDQFLFPVLDTKLRFRTISYLPAGCAQVEEAHWPPLPGGSARRQAITRGVAESRHQRRLRPSSRSGSMEPNHGEMLSELTGTIHDDHNLIRYNELWNMTAVLAALLR